jgi:hypothetical protein
MANPRRSREVWAWNTFSKGINGNLITERVENLCGNGMPDVVCQNSNGVTFWIENKDIEFWPKRPTTVVMSRTFEPGQLGWARQWNWRGGYSFVLARIEMEYYLFDPSKKIEEMTRHELVACAIRIGKADILEYLYTLKHRIK